MPNLRHLLFYFKTFNFNATVNRSEFYANFSCVSIWFHVGTLQRNYNNINLAEIDSLWILVTLYIGTGEHVEGSLLRSTSG